MLILSRTPGEAIVIDGGIRIVVLACDARSVRLGIEAPGNVGIVREEIVLQIAEENRRAAAPARPQTPAQIRRRDGGQQTRDPE